MLVRLLRLVAGGSAGFRRLILFCFVPGMTVLFSAPAGAHPDSPLFTRHLSPVSQLFGLPPAEGGRLNREGRLDVRLVVNAANSFAGGSGEGESLSFVGESSRYEMALRYGLFRGSEIGIDVPYITHQPGYLNDLINEFHDLFGLSSNWREKEDGDRIHYVYRRDGIGGFSVTEEAGGSGIFPFTFRFPSFAPYTTGPWRCAGESSCLPGTRTGSWEAAAPIFRFA